MHVPWEQMQLLLAVAESKSLTKAAERLRITQPTASRRLADLEAQLGERLFDRSALGVTPTAFAERMIEPARRMAEWAGEVERAADRADTAVSGAVRITAPPGIAFELGAPFAAWLKAKLPDVRLEIVSSVQYLDLVRREADLALRIGPPTSQRELVTLATFEHTVGAFAAEAYVRSLPAKPTLADIGWIGWAPPLDHISPNPELARLIPGWQPVFSSDDYLVQLRAAEVGLGAIFLGRGRHRFSTSTLVEITSITLPPIQRSVQLICARTALEIPRVRAVAELLAGELRAASEPARRRRGS